MTMTETEGISELWMERIMVRAATTIEPTHNRIIMADVHDSNNETAMMKNTINQVSQISPTTTST